jgi:hypothetical protein
MKLSSDDYTDFATIDTAKVIELKTVASCEDCEKLLGYKNDLGKFAIVDVYGEVIRNPMCRRHLNEVITEQKRLFAADVNYFIGSEFDLE